MRKTLFFVLCSLLLLFSETSFAQLVYDDFNGQTVTFLDGLSTGSG